MKLEKYITLIPYGFLFGSLAFVGCAGRILNPVDTAPVAQSLSTIDKEFQAIQTAKTKKEVQQAAVSGRKEVVSANQKLLVVQKTADALAGERDWWKNDSEKKSAELIKKEQVIRAKNARISVLSLGLAVLAGLAVFFILGAFQTVIFQFYPPAAPFFLLLQIGGAAGTTALIWAALRYL
jgi:hypothetical protein